MLKKKHQTNSLVLLCSSTGPGANVELKLALLQKKNVFFMLMATNSVQAADGTGFLLETLFEVARLEDKEACRIYAMDGLFASAGTDAPTIYSSITDADGVGEAANPPPLPSSDSRAAPPPPPFEQWDSKG